MLQEARGTHPGIATPARPDPALINDWHAVAFSKDVKEDDLVRSPAARSWWPGGHNGKVHGLEGSLHPSRGAAVEGLGRRRQGRLPVSRLALRRRSQVRPDPGASRHAAAAQGARLSASAPRSATASSGARSATRRTTFRRFPNGAARIPHLPRRPLPVRRQCIPFGRELHRRHPFPVRACAASTAS